MSNELTNAMLWLAENPGSTRDILGEPGTLSDELGLSPDQIEILKSRDAGEIRKAIAQEIGGTQAADAAGLTVIVLTYERSVQASISERTTLAFRKFQRGIQ